jgi:putative cell wall-binding protein
VQVALSGSGGALPNPGALQASSPTLAFGEVRQGERPSRSVTLTNTGGTELTIDPPALSGDQVDVFSATLEGASVSLAPGASATLTVTFAPDRVGAASATVALAHSGANGPVSIGLSGTGLSAGQAGVSRLFDVGGRVETAAAVSRATFSPGVEVAYVATALDFPDALAAGPAAGRLGGPILLTGKSLPLPAATVGELERLAPKRIVVLGGTAVLTAELADALGPYATTGVVERLDGPDRFGTAAKVSERHFAEGVPVVYVANGMVFPDALSGGSPAALQGGPLLLVSEGGIPQATAAELRRLEPERVVVLGGELRVPKAVVDELATYATTKTAARLSGATRYGTSADVASKTFTGPVDVVYVATGEKFPDALAAVPAAAKDRAPLLLVHPDGIAPEVSQELQRLAPRRIVVLGGDAAVPQRVYDALARYARV